jgi:hypothetical protein
MSPLATLTPEYQDQPTYFDEQCLDVGQPNQLLNPNEQHVNIFSPSAGSLLPVTTPLSVSSSPLPDLLAALNLYKERDRQQEERIQQLEEKIRRLESERNIQLATTANLAKPNQQLTVRWSRPLQSPSISQVSLDDEQTQDQDIDARPASSSHSSDLDSSATLLSGILDRPTPDVSSDPSSIAKFYRDCGDSANLNLPGSNSTQYMGENTVVSQQASEPQSSDSAYGTISNETSSEGIPAESSRAADQISKSVDNSSEHPVNDMHDCSGFLNCEEPDYIQHPVEIIWP